MHNRSAHHTSQEAYFAHSAKPDLRATQSLQGQGDLARGARPVDCRHLYLPRNPPSNGNVEIRLRQVQQHSIPTPANRPNKPPDQLRQTDLISNGGYEPKTAKAASLTEARSRSATREYPQQNFSFRRAVRRSLSSESEKEHGDTKREITVHVLPPQNGDKGSRKSDDRDSGTVVEPEASVFDFDSSVISDNDDKPSSQNNHGSHSNEDHCSRSNTPTLPPLPWADEYTNIPNHDDNDVKVDRKSTQLNQSRTSDHDIGKFFVFIQ